MKGAYNTGNTLDRNSTLSCSLSNTSAELIAGYQNMGCFRLALRNWWQNTQKPSLLKLFPRTVFPTTQIGMFLQYWCTTTVLSKGLMLVYRNSVERNAHLNVSCTTQSVSIMLVQVFFCEVSSSYSSLFSWLDKKITACVAMLKLQLPNRSIQFTIFVYTVIKMP